LSFKQISELLDIPVQQLEFLNPIFKLNIIPYELEKPHFLRLPKNKMGLFVSNEDKIYAYLEYLETLKEKTKIEINPSVSKDSLVSNLHEKNVIPEKIVRKMRFYTIKSGDNLMKIAEKQGVLVSDLKKWNNLKSNAIFSGQKLKIQSNLKETPQPETPSKKSEFYTVQKGDTLFIISKKHPGVTVDDLKKWNSIPDDAIQPGMKLKING
jgi:membrane-bound lytic murein transglycosylase D